MSRNPDQLAEILDGLVAELPGVSGVILEEWLPPEDGASDDEIDTAFEALAEAFASTVEALEASWGPPSYRGAVDDGDFPAWSEALLLATWERGETLGFVGLRTDDRSLPMFLELGALTRDEVATLTIGRAP